MQVWARFPLTNPKLQNLLWGYVWPFKKLQGKHQPRSLVENQGNTSTHAAWNNQMTFPKLARKKNRGIKGSATSPLPPRYSWSVLPGPRPQPHYRVPRLCCAGVADSVLFKVLFPVFWWLRNETWMSHMQRAFFGLSDCFIWSFLYNLMDMFWCVCTFPINYFWFCNDILLFDYFLIYHD